FMPIKFRCVHCNQKLGIAHRKAGTQVQCPTCLRMVMVPVPEAEPVSGAHAPPAAPVRAEAPPLFEQSDFDDLLKPAAKRPAVSHAAAPASVPAHAQVWSVPLPSSYDAEANRTLSGESAAGILLTPGRATLLTALVVLLLGVAFGAGLLVGRAF